MNISHSFEDAEQFTSALIEAVGQDVEDNVERMSPEECVAFTRDFLELMQQWQPEAIDLSASPLEGAAHGLYLAMLMPHVFQKAYLHSNKFLAAKESIKKALEDQ